MRTAGVNTYMLHAQKQVDLGAWSLEPGAWAWTSRSLRDTILGRGGSFGALELLGGWGALRFFGKVWQCAVSVQLA